MATASALEGLPPMQRRDSMARKMTKMFKRPDTHAAFLTSSRFALDLIKVGTLVALFVRGSRLCRKNLIPIVCAFLLEAASIRDHSGERRTTQHFRCSSSSCSLTVGGALPAVCGVTKHIHMGIVYLRCHRFSLYSLSYPRPCPPRRLSDNYIRADATVSTIGVADMQQRCSRRSRRAHFLSIFVNGFVRSSRIAR